MSNGEFTMPKEMKRSKTTGDERLTRWTDKSNSYERLDPSEHEKPNSVFPFEENGKENRKSNKNKK